MSSCVIAAHVWQPRRPSRRASLSSTGRRGMRLPWQRRTAGLRRRSRSRGLRPRTTRSTRRCPRPGSSCERSLGRRREPVRRESGAANLSVRSCRIRRASTSRWTTPRSARCAIRPCRSTSTPRTFGERATFRDATRSSPPWSAPVSARSSSGSSSSWSGRVAESPARSCCRIAPGDSSGAARSPRLNPLREGSRSARRAVRPGAPSRASGDRRARA